MSEIASSLRQLRIGLQEHVASDLEIETVPGRIGGPVEQRPIACVWTDSVEEEAGAIAAQIIRLGVRVLLPRPHQTAVERPPDPSKLEDLAERLQLCVSKHQTGLVGAWFQRVERVDVDLDGWAAEASVIAYSENLSV